VSEQQNDNTQPIAVNGSTAAPTPEEGTQPVKVSSNALQTQLPEWLLKFAASPEKSEEDTQPGGTPDLQAPFLEDLEEEQAFTPPVMPGENEWQEIGDFQEEETLEIEPTSETREIESAVETFEAPEAGMDASLIETVGEPVAEDSHVQAIETFRQEIRDFLNQGQREKALTLIRENKTDPVFAEAAKQTLRSQLTLASDAGDLWDIYDELNSASD
jgi:hypothetical protein